MQSVLETVCASAMATSWQCRSLPKLRVSLGDKTATLRVSKMWGNWAPRFWGLQRKSGSCSCFCSEMIFDMFISN